MLEAGSQCKAPGDGLQPRRRGTSPRSGGARRRSLPHMSGANQKDCASKKDGEGGVLLLPLLRPAGTRHLWATQPLPVFLPLANVPQPAWSKHGLALAPVKRNPESPVPMAAKDALAALLVLLLLAQLLCQAQASVILQVRGSAGGVGAWLADQLACRGAQRRRRRANWTCRSRGAGGALQADTWTPLPGQAVWAACTTVPACRCRTCRLGKTLPTML